MNTFRLTENYNIYALHIWLQNRQVPHKPAIFQDWKRIPKKSQSVDCIADLCTEKDSRKEYPAVLKLSVKSESVCPQKEGWFLPEKPWISFWERTESFSRRGPVFHSAAADDAENASQSADRKKSENHSFRIGSERIFRINVIVIESPAQMIDFMLQNHGQKSFCLDHDRFSSQGICSFYFNSPGPVYMSFPVFRYRQTAFS